MVMVAHSAVSWHAFWPMVWHHSAFKGCTSQTTCLGRARGSSSCCNAAGYSEQRSKTLADAPRPCVRNLQTVCGHPGLFSESLPLALCSQRPAGERQALAVVHLLRSNDESENLLEIVSPLLSVGVDVGTFVS